MKTVVLVHGSWHGAWCWHRVVDGLQNHDVPVVAVNMPLGGLAVDAASVRAELDAVDDDVVLCGHSYGGFVISRATSPDFEPTRVSHLVYLCAFMAPEGTDAVGLLSEHGSYLAPRLQVADGNLVVPDDVLVPAFYADCDDDDIALARRSLRPVPIDEPPPRVRPGFEAIPSTYIVCTQDQAIPPSVQRMFAASAGDVVEWDTSHSPFFSRPDLVVELLTKLATT
jgi:pimeloyl-ACP methyl ester carboxylesterase